VVRSALSTGPVLVHSPRSGYQPALACDGCRMPARCRRCAGPLGRVGARADEVCRWCGHNAHPWTCPHCSAHALRSPVVGSLRTVEEWGKSFPQTTVVSSGGDHVVDRIGRASALVIATPGAEPRADGGYAAAVLLDTWLTVGRPGLRAAEEALRRWLNIAALVRPRAEGGRVIAVGEADNRVLQALVRWDPAGYAARELADRRSARLPPAVRLATVVADPDALQEALAAAALPRHVEVLGPTEVADGQARMVVRTAQERGAGMTAALHRMQASRSTRKLSPVSVHVDPADLV
jgi:primosomal protein N' (replication factor Y) (superfamily II helicase)